MRNLFVAFVFVTLAMCCSFRFFDEKQDNSLAVYLGTAIPDYINTNVYGGKYRAFKIRNIRFDDGFCTFSISPVINAWQQDIGDSIGSRTSYFPTSYIESDDRLFLWTNESERINSKTLSKMHEYGVLDSFFIKNMKQVVVNGDTVSAFNDSVSIINNNYPEELIIEDLEYVVYSMCINDATKFKKRVSKFSSNRKKTTPKLNCR